MEPITLCLFGGFEARGGDHERVALPTRKAALLLAFLALSPGRAQAREKLIGLLWGSRGEAQARSSLRHALSALRKALGAAAIVAERDAVLLAPDAVTSDVGQFERLVAEATPEALARAATLYRGDLLEGTSVAEPAFQEWLSFEQARLRELARRALAKLLDHQAASGASAEAIEIGRRLLAFDSLQEDVHRALMRLYAADGQRGLALEQYQACRRLLAEDLGLRPDQETENLLREIRRQPAHGTERPAPLEPAGEPDAADAAPAADAVSEQELRPATIAYITLSSAIPSSTEADAPPDSEDWHRALGRFLASAAEVAERYGGALETGLGGSAMAVFGVPRAHHDDAERAVRAAAELHEMAEALAHEMKLPFSAQIGLASGPVLAGGSAEKAAAVTGEAVNLAAQLSAAAAPGQALIAGGLYRDIGHVARAIKAARVPRKGGGYVETWRLDELKSPAPATASLPMIGRQAELRQLEAALDACRETGRGQTIYLRGEAGIGKSRLIQELAARAKARGFACHEVLALDFGVGEGQDPIRALVRGLTRVSRQDTAPAREAAAEEALAEGLVAADQRAFLNDLLDLPQPAEARGLYDAMDQETRMQGKYATLATLVRGTAHKGPLLVIVEDLHAAGRPTLAHLAYLAASIADLPAVLVMTSRIEDDPLDQAWRQAALGSAFLTLDLGPLSHDQALELAGGYPERPSETVERCIERAQGNPLFLEQLLQHAEAGGEEQLPATLQSLVTARMDRLAPLDKRALQAASTIGQRFTLEALRSLIESPNFRCTRLLDHQLVRPVGQAYLFGHALIRDGVYGSLLKSRRRALHLKAAAWFRDRDAQVYAEHLDRAGDARAAQAYLEAARRAFAEYRLDRALRLARRGAALSGDAAERAASSLLEGDILHHAGAMADSIEAYKQALENSEDDTTRCRAWIGLAAAMRVTDAYDAALEALDEAEALAAPAGLSSELSRIHSLRGNLYFPLGRISACKEQHALALKFARRAKSKEAEAQALSGLGDADYAQGRMIGAADHFRRCIDLCRRHGFGRIEVANRQMLGLTRLYLNDLRGGLEESLEAVEAARRAGHQRAEIVARTVVGTILAEMVDIGGLRQQMDASQELIRQLGAWRFECENLYGLGVAARLNGDREAAERLLRDSVASAEETGFDYMGASILGALAWACADPNERRAALARAEAALDAEAIGHNHLWFYRYGMEAALEMADWPRVERYAAALEDYTRAQPLPWADFYIARGRALAAVGRGARDEKTLGEIARLRAAAEEVGLKIAVPALDAALATE